MIKAFYIVLTLFLGCSIDQTGCTNPSACNYSDTAISDDGSCYFAEEGLDCYGFCEDSAYDCMGECFGPAITDGNGECCYPEDMCGIMCYDCPGAPIVSIYFSSTYDISGFQFQMEGTNILSASGGLAEGNGFTISHSSNTVIGFSLVEGVFIPAGQGVLIELELDNEDACITNPIATGSGGISLDITLNDCLSIAIGECGGNGIPDGACDCEGNVEDCLGECGGDAVIDDNGECCYSDDMCDNMCFYEIDECGECNVPGAGYQCWDGSLVCEENDCPNAPIVPIYFSSPYNIYGFQFGVDNATILSASGGAAEDAGFLIQLSSSSTFVLGFSLEGTSIPAGDEILIELELDNEDACITDLVLTGPAGTALNYTLDCQSITVID